MCPPVLFFLAFHWRPIPIMNTFDLWSFLFYYSRFWFLPLQTSMIKMNILPVGLAAVAAFISPAEARGRSHRRWHRHSSPSGVIPFTEFTAGNHSHSLGFVLDHHWGDFIWGNGRSNAPQPLYQDIIYRCQHLGNITASPGTQDTAKLLAMTKWNNYGIDFLFTDAINYEDPFKFISKTFRDPPHNETFRNSASTTVLPKKTIAQRLEG